MIDNVGHVPDVRVIEALLFNHLQENKEVINSIVCFFYITNIKTTYSVIYMNRFGKLVRLYF